MRAMKDSGIEWLDQIPENWRLERLKFHAKLNPATQLPEYGDTDEVSFIPMDNLKAGYHTVSSNTYRKVKSGYVVFQNGDVLMAKVTPCLENGNIAIADSLKDGVGFGSTEINVLRCFDMNNRYLFYLLQCPTYIHRARYDMFGVAGLKRLDPGFLPNSYFPIPDADEQQRIVEYINRRCSEIDSLISAKEKTNALLREQRQSIIYETVTKGLNPDAPMKDSGVEWIGKIPDGWNVVALKRIAEFATGSTPSKNNPEFWEGDIAWLSSKDLKTDYLYDSQDHITQKAVDDCGLKLLPENSLVICVRSGILRHTFPVSITKMQTTINQDLRSMEVCEDCVPDYLLYYLRGMNDTIVKLYQKIGATVESIEMDWLLYLPVACPDYQEQLEIVEYLHHSCKKIDTIISANESTIQKLKEYRQSVIYEAVTGKIEV